VRDALVLCARGTLGSGGQRFLFEVIPDLFPQPYMTEAERLLWQRFYVENSGR
jgi:hypothetical protein